MINLHDTITRTYKSIFKLFQIEVLTENGWEDIDSLNITSEQDAYEVKSEHNKLICTKDHILIDENGNEIFAKDSLNQNIKSINGISKIISVRKLNKSMCFYDLSLSGKTHTYYTNGLLSHNCVVCDEFAFLPNNLADKLFTSMFPVISSSKNGKFIIVSTPNGTGNLFYKIWQQANEKDKTKNKNGWNPFIMWWWQVPGHDEKWKADQIAAIGKERFAQEFNNEFLAGSSFRKLIPEDIIEKYRQRNVEYKLKNEYVGKNLQIEITSANKVYEFTMWDEFKQGHNYIAAGDVSEGTGGDYSVIYVFDITHLDKIKMCAKFSNNKIFPVEFAYVTNKILSLYNDPYYICESNGVGSAYLDVLRVTYGYQNIVKEGKDGGYGIRSHAQVKGRACLWLQEMFTTDGFNWILPDMDLVDELNTFVKTNSKSVANIGYAAMTGAHDDLVMTLCWAAWMMNPDIIEKYSIVVETFTSSMEKILPKTTQSMFEPTINQIQTIFQDPILQRFMEFRQDVEEKFKTAKMLEQLEKKKNLYDPFSMEEIQNKTVSDLREARQNMMEQQLNNKTSYIMPQFFLNSSGDDYDFDGESW